MTGENDATHRPRILILSTGGTIAGAARKGTAIGYRSGSVSISELLASVPGVEHVAELTAEPVAAIGSQDMTETVRMKLRTRVLSAVERDGYDGVVITHGTDTMEETAFFLHETLSLNAPVVLTGAMRPASALSTDGPANLYGAVLVATTKTVSAHGVVLVMNGEIHGANAATKADTSGVQAFASPNTGPLGYVNPSGVTLTGAPPANPKLRRQQSAPVSPHPRVEILYCYTGATADMVEVALASGARGLVVAGFGNGNAPAEVITALEKAAAAGVVVVRSTRAASGLVYRNVEIDDDAHGFVAAHDLNPQKARILTQLLIAADVTTPDMVQSAFWGV